MRLLCEYCKEEVYVNLYFYDVRILTHEMCTPSTRDDDKYYEALVYGKAICPNCGRELRQLFKKEINRNAIIKLAGGEAVEY